MGKTVLAVVQGEPSPQASSTIYRDKAWTAVPPLLLKGIVVLLGVYMPPFFDKLLRDAAAGY